MFDPLKRSWRSVTLALSLMLGVVLISSAQLQQSGGPGSTVTVGSALPAGTNVIGHVIADTGSTTAVTGNVTAVQTTGSNLHVAVDSAPTTAVTGTFWQTTQPVSGSVSVTGALPAGTNVLGTVNSIPKTACGNTVASQALAAVPTSATAVFSSTTCVIAVVMNNTTSGSLTVTVTDNSGTPINDVITFSIPAFSQLIQPLYGVAFTSGLKWTASASGITGAVIGYQ